MPRKHPRPAAKKRAAKRKEKPVRKPQVATIGHHHNSGLGLALLAASLIHRNRRPEDT